MFISPPFLVLHFHGVNVVCPAFPVTGGGGQVSTGLSDVGVREESVYL